VAKGHRHSFVRGHAAAAMRIARLAALSSSRPRGHGHDLDKVLEEVADRAADSGPVTPDVAPDQGPADVGFDVPALPDAPLPDVVRPSDVPPDAPAADAPEAGCAADASLCGGRCLELSSDPDNCGACGMSCAALAGVTPAGVRCGTGRCRIDRAYRTAGPIATATPQTAARRIPPPRRPPAAAAAPFVPEPPTP
jgi:hypothetical protein